MSILLRFARVYSWRYHWQLAGAFVSMVVGTLAALLVPHLIGSAIDEALDNGVRSRFLLVAGFILLAAGVRVLFGYWQNFLTEAVSHAVSRDVRNDLYAKLQALSFAFHDRQQTGDLMSRLTSDVDSVRYSTTVALIRVPAVVLIVAPASVLMLRTDWRLGLIALTFVPLVAWRSSTMIATLRRTWDRVQAETGQMNTVLQENLAGIRLVKAFGARRHEEARFAARASSVARDTYAAGKIDVTYSCLMNLAFVLVIGAMVWVGGRDVVAGRLTEGELAAVLLYVGLMEMPLYVVGWLVSSGSRAAASGKRLFELLDARSPVEEKQGARALPQVRGHIRFEGVYMEYDSHAPAVHDVSFEVQPGQLVAIMGAPGSGKSTVAHLVPRFYDATAGRVTLDGVDVRDVTLASLRRNVGIVLQETAVFGGTLRDNIAYGDAEATLDDIVRAATTAQLHDFIAGLPDGYDTWVGERGVTLSGGQRQRLAIARTLLADPPVLVLDDSTASVDVGTEYLFQQALSQVIKGRTTIVIAHRLSTVRQADMVLVMDHGRVVQQGTHRELLARPGYYRGIHDMQLAPTMEEVFDRRDAPPLRGDAR